MKSSSIKAIIKSLAQVNGATFISLDTVTVPEMNRTMSGNRAVPNPHFGHITKRQTGSSVMVFQNKRVNGYENMVRKRLLEEGFDPDSFVLSPRRWGVRIPNMPIVEHEDGTYLEVIFLRPGPVEYMLDGEPIARNEVIGIREYGPSPSSQGGLLNKVHLRVFSFDSITRLRIANTEYHLTHS